MSKKIYILTELEQEIINQMRKNNCLLIKENVETQLLLNQKNDEHVAVKMRQTLSRGESIIIDKSLYPHQAPIDDFFLFFKRLLGCTK